MGIRPAPMQIRFDGKRVLPVFPWKPGLGDEEAWIKEGGDLTFSEWCEKKRSA